MTTNVLTDNFYTTNEVAEILDVPKSTIYFWRSEENLAKGMLPEPVRKGRTLLWDKVVFHDWLNERNLAGTTVEDGVINVLSAVNAVIKAVTENTDLEEPLTRVRDSANAALKSM